MNISLDYDGTYTNDPAFWEDFIKLAAKHGHEVKCVTMRYPHEGAKISCDVIYTCRQPKAQFYDANVWIDDMPNAIFGALA